MTSKLGLPRRGWRVFNLVALSSLTCWCLSQEALNSLWSQLQWQSRACWDWGGWPWPWQAEGEDMVPGDHTLAAQVSPAGALFKMDIQGSDFRFSHLGLWGTLEVNSWTAKEVVVDYPTPVSSHRWEITALFYSASQLWIFSCMLARTISLSLFFLLYNTF